MTEPTLAEARKDLRESLDEGVVCPCCEQTARRYRRTIHASMASALLNVYRANGVVYAYVPDSLTHRQNADFAKLAYWGLIDAERETLRDDGSNRTGRWRVTDLGRRWARGETTVPKYALVYNGNVEAHDGPGVRVWDALGSAFDYEKLMGRAPDDILDLEKAKAQTAPTVDEFDGQLFIDTGTPPPRHYDPEVP